MISQLAMFDTDGYRCCTATELANLLNPDALPWPDCVCGYGRA